MKRKAPAKPTFRQSGAAGLVTGLAGLFVFAWGAEGCRKQGCLGGDDGSCLPAPACGKLQFSCAGGSVRVGQINAAAERMPGSKAQGAAGDLILENDRVRIVLAAPEHPQGLAPSGGGILDFGLAGPGDEPQSGDALNQVYQAAGLLPRDAIRYQTVEIVDHAASPAGAFVAVVFRGHLDGDRRVTAVTRYELRPCEPGVRVRTELYNGAPDPNTFALTDAYFWGDRTLLPFVPLPGQGFRQPELELLNLAAAWRSWPFLAARPQAAPFVAYAVVPCDGSASQGFNEVTLSASGVGLRPTLSRDSLSFERFILAARGPGLSAAVGLALGVRSMLRDEPPPVSVTGRVVVAGVPFDSDHGRTGSLLAYEAGPPGHLDDPAARTPWSEAVPLADGRFEFQLPPNKTYRIQAYAFGQAASEPVTFKLTDESLDIGDVAFAGRARLSVTVTEASGAATDFADVVVVPASAREPSASPSTLYGVFGPCEPLLGPPHGASPACNRAVTVAGQVVLSAPPGRFFVYASRGPFATIARAEVILAPGDDRALTLTSRLLPSLLPPGVLTGDFHVHGGASYDSGIPDRDRVASFVSHGVDVVVATDHDVVTSYARALTALGIPAERLRVIPGVEATPNILWFRVPGETFPKTVGHFNFWPLVEDPLAARNGAPWDELLEPGGLMDAMEPLFASGTAAGVRQMNHPWSDDKLGRDQGFLRMIAYDPRRSIHAGDSFAADVLLRQPGGGHRNLDWDVQEVMTGADPQQWLRYRTLWFSLLAQGLLKAGAANSDTHGLAVEQVGYPRNLVWSSQSLEAFDADRFDADVRLGHMVGTTGPVIDVYIEGAGTGAAKVRPGLTPFTPTPGAALVIETRAAPWIPVEEVRVFVNGRRARTISVSDGFVGLDPFGEKFGAAVVRVPLDELDGVAERDTFIVVEAGLPEPATLVDPETGLPDLSVAIETPGAGDPRAHLEAIAPGVWPVAFSNPFLIDLAGDGWTAPGLSEMAKNK